MYFRIAYDEHAHTITRQKIQVGSIHAGETDRVSVNMNRFVLVYKIQE